MTPDQLAEANRKHAEIVVLLTHIAGSLERIAYCTDLVFQAARDELDNFKLPVPR